MSIDILKDKIAGALYGVAVGDALGAPLEFMSAEEISREYGYVTDMVGGGWLNVRPGETTDDTAMTLAVAEGIMERPDSPIEAIGERFINWADSDPKDIGGTCRCAIWKAAEENCKRPSAIQWFNAAKETATIGNGHCGGNGALMRTVYPGLFYKSRLMAVETAGSIARMTHDDQASTEACQFYTDALFLITEAEGYDNRGNICASIAKLMEPTRYNLEELEKRGSAGLNPTGWVVDSLECALYSFLETAASFEKAITFAVNLGGDTDTIAAICGGLAGAYYGYKAIPKRWVKTLSESDRKRLDTAIEAAVKNRIQPAIPRNTAI